LAHRGVCKRFEILSAVIRRRGARIDRRFLKSNAMSGGEYAEAERAFAHRF
jgi:hypothetical protein